MKGNLLTTIFLMFLVATQAQDLTITPLGRYTDGNEGACEISSYDSESERLFVTNANANTIDILDVTDWTMPSVFTSIDVTPYGGGVNSVASLGNGHFAAAIQAEVKQDPGFVVFFDTDGSFVSQVTVGALPDMVTVTPDGNKVLVANEGEPNDAYDVDPEGSISIIDISGGVAELTADNVTTLTLENAPADLPGAIFRPNTPVAQDLEPEYIAVNAASDLAVVVCQESNAIITVDLEEDTIMAFFGLGFKDHSLAGNAIDASNKDEGINIQNWSVKGVYQPDAIAVQSINGIDYILTANEGDGRDYEGYSSETRIKDLTLDATAFPDAETLQMDENLGRLKTFTPDVIGDTDDDGDVDELYSYGARSFSIWATDGTLVWDSGSAIEDYMAANHSDFFNCNDGLAEEMDNRSDDKGPEPEAITTAQIGDNYYAFIGLERQGGILVYDISTPTAPVFVEFVNSFDSATGTMIDVAPEDVDFIAAADSHTDENIMVVSNEVSGTVTFYSVTDNTTGNSDLDGDMAFSLSPNPTSGPLNISLPNDGAARQISVTNSLGQILWEKEVSNSNEAWDATNLAAGLYRITVRDMEGKVLVTMPFVRL